MSSGYPSSRCSSTGVPASSSPRPNSCFRSRRVSSGQEPTSSSPSPQLENGEMKFRIGEHPKEALSVMAMMKRNKTLCDVKLIVGNEIFYAHKLVLASSSPYFKAMFTSGLRECEMNSVTLQGVCPITMGHLLCFMYTSEVCLNESNVCHLLPAATMFQMTHVIDACCAYLEQQLDASNALGIATFGQQHGCMDLYRASNDFVDQHFARVSHEEEFLALTACQLVALVKRDQLNVRCEKEVYEAVLRWVRHDERQRRPQMERVLGAVRCHYLTPDFLSEQIKHCDLLGRLPQCREYLIRIFQDLTLHRAPCIKQRTPNATGVVLVAGGYLRHSIGHVECYNAAESRWSTLQSLPVPCSGLGGAFVQGLFYAVGGRNNSPEGNQDLNSADCFDPAARLWKRCAPMNVARHRVGVGVVDGLLYAVGGCYGAQIHNSVERYHPEEDRWEYVQPMATKRIGVGVAVVNRLLYAVGGFDGTCRLSSVECYHPERNEWIGVSNMRTKRSACGLAALDQYIYAVGGYDGTSQLKTVERCNIETNEWEFVSSMKSPRSALSVAVLDGKLYALGGYDGADFLSTVENYDPVKDEWTDSPPMSSGRSGHAAAVWMASGCKFH